jgi:hypothetical protein
LKNPNVSKKLFLATKCHFALSAKHIQNSRHCERSEAIFLLYTDCFTAFAKTWLSDFNWGFTAKKTKNNSQEPFFRKNATFHPILSTKLLITLSTVNYRLQSTNYCKETLNHRDEHEKKKLFFEVESF